MSTWLGIAVAAQFLFAIGVLVDRHIVVRAEHIGKPIVLAFYVSLMSGCVIVLAPFGISLPSTLVVTLSLAAAVAFLAGIFFLYSALRIGHAADVAPVVGAVSAITTVILAAFSLEGDITPILFVPVALLILGTALISRFHFTTHTLLYTVCSGFGLGVMFLLVKLVFLEVPFLDGFFWTRMMNVVVALGLLLVPVWRMAILKGGTHSSRGAKLLVVGNKILAGAASVLMAFAVSLGPVSVVNALSGLQFVFVFVLTLLFARFMPGPRKFTSHVHVGLGHTAAGIACIVLGLGLLYWMQLV
jgi:uncharacterized membrane protein